MEGKSREQGMTVLEVAVALTILMIGVGFVLQSDAVSHKYAYRSQVREQMLFYAAGVLEAEMEGVTPAVTIPGFTDFVPVMTTHRVNDHLEKIEVKVSLRNSPTDPEPVVLATYRVIRE
ncbi:pilin/secretion family protein with methylation motif [Desulfitobacterium sp. LBE]|uniref:Prepilin-type N-terminal cleavage/methylation domain-containing protein n=1 Tax=Desulfitobacterium hafniense (strain DSM 10664 / DCB-2) TaxID=272564 RepID=B8FQA9_DESHD|nr:MULTISPECIES: prepilin-type N-terminal cleavage/methylation domain-containing protein [Desulfitobacterium]ACL21570.1 hypothetical protein Dhaf_3552 [Desulfitobacterium hafniense DCB-2]TWH60640.1 pilin/secretion family protein with methylation motif [Desulfitobacterium sp. LBE]